MTPAKWIITAIALSMMFLNKLILPQIPMVTEIGSSTIYIFVAALTLMICVDTKWPVILTVLAYATNHIYTMSDAIRMSFGHSVAWIVILSGMVLGVLIDAGLIRRIAVWMITRKFVKKNPWLLVIMLFLAGLLIGDIMDPTVTMILMMALCNEILKALGIKKGNRVGEFLMMGLMVFVAMSYGATTLGHSVPLSLMSLFEEVGTYNQLQYCLVGMSISAIYFVLYILLYRFVFKEDLSALKNYDPDELKKTVPPISKTEIVGAFIYSGVIILWLLPSILTSVAPRFSAYVSSLGAAAPLIAAIAIMALIRVDGKQMMDIPKQLSTGVPWAAALLVGTNMLLASSISNADAGISTALGTLLGPVFQNMSPFVFVLLINVACMIITNITANMLIATILASIVIPLISSGAVIGVNAGALAFTLGLTSTMAFALAPCAAWAALIVGDGWVRTRVQIGEGMLVASISCLLTSTVGYYFMAALLK